MRKKEKSKEQLIDELIRLQQQIDELEKSEIRHLQIEKALTDNEEKYRILVELAADGIIIQTLEGRILECNTAGAKIYGYTKEEMLGLTIADLVPEGFAVKLPKLITEKEDTQGVFVPWMSKKKDGTIFPTEISTKIVHMGEEPRIITYVHDITERKEAEKKLRKVRKIFTSLFNSSPIAALYHDEDGRILNVNPYFTKTFGYTLKEIVGRNIDEGMIYPESKMDEGEKLTKQGLNLEGISEYETIRKKKDGTLISVVISASPVIIDGQPKGTIALYRDITERKRTEETLQKSQQEFAGLFKNSPEAMSYVDNKGNIIDINPRFTELFGYNLNEVRGKNIDNGMIHPPEKMEEGKWMTEKALKGKFYYETVRKKKDGTLFPVSISSSRIMLGGKLQGMIGIYRDITERKQEEQLRQVLYNISKAANSTISLDQLYPLIHQELGTIIDTTNFYIALLDEKEDKLYFPYHVDEKDNHFPSRKFSTTNTLTAYVIRTGKSLLNDNSQYKEMIDQGVLSPWGSTTPQSIWLGVPLKIEDKTIGVMAIQSYTNPRLYTEKDIQLLEFVSSQVATAIERKRTEENLLKSQQEFASLFNSSPEALVYLDEKGNIIDINPRFTELFGYTLEEVKGRNINNGMIHPLYKIEEGKNIDKVITSKRYFNYETIRKKKDGTIFPVLISGSIIKIDAQIKGIVITYIDITERKRLEKKLEKLAHFDVLTGCYARGYGLSLFERQIKSAQRYKTSILLLYIDLDGLKYINDNFGHKEGDKVLKEMGKFFKSILREVDIICRMGGDEFLLIFPNSSLEDVPLIKERIDNKLKELNKNLNNPYKISFSIGTSCYDPSNPLPIGELTRIADERMYEEKKKKKGEI